MCLCMRLLEYKAFDKAEILSVAFWETPSLDCMG